MSLDAQAIYSDNQAVTASGVSTNVYDAGPGVAGGVRDIGPGEPIFLVVSVGPTGAAAAGAATVQFALEVDDNVGFASPTVLWSSAVIGKTALGPGAKVACVPLPYGMERFSRVTFTVATGPLTAGGFFAYLTREPAAWKAYGDNYEVA